MSKRQADTLTSIIIILILSLVSSMIIGIGGYAANLIILVATLGVALGVGALFLILRFLKILKHPRHFMYNYFGTLNLALALFELGDILIQKKFYLVKLPLICFVIGTAILYDIYKRRTTNTVITNVTI